MKPTIEPRTALLYIMVVTAVADRKWSDAEQRMIADMVRIVPALSGVDLVAMNKAAGDCIALLDDENGLDKVLDMVKTALPQRLWETGYALACDVVAVDGKAGQEELHWLEMLADSFNIDPLAAAAIERGAHARFKHP